MRSNISTCSILIGAEGAAATGAAACTGSGITGFASVGVPLGDVPSMRRDIPTAVARIGRDLLLGDLAQHTRRIRADVPPDFSSALYASALWKPARASGSAA